MSLGGEAAGGRSDPPRLSFRSQIRSASFSRRRISEDRSRGSIVRGTPAPTSSSIAKKVPTSSRSGWLPTSSSGDVTAPPFRTVTRSFGAPVPNPLKHRRSGPGSHRSTIVCSAPIDQRHETPSIAKVAAPPSRTTTSNNSSEGFGQLNEATSCSIIQSSPCPPSFDSRPRLDRIGSGSFRESSLCRSRKTGKGSFPPPSPAPLLNAKSDNQNTTQSQHDMTSSSQNRFQPLRPAPLLLDSYNRRHHTTTAAVAIANSQHPSSTRSLPPHQSIITQFPQRVAATDEDNQSPSVNNNDAFLPSEPGVRSSNKQSEFQTTIDSSKATVCSQDAASSVASSFTKGPEEEDHSQYQQIAPHSSFDAKVILDNLSELKAGVANLQVAVASINAQVGELLSQFNHLASSSSIPKTTGLGVDVPIQQVRPAVPGQFLSNDPSLNATTVLSPLNTRFEQPSEEAATNVHEALKPYSTEAQIAISKTSYGNSVDFLLKRILGLLITLLEGQSGDSKAISSADKSQLTQASFLQTTVKRKSSSSDAVFCSNEVRSDPVGQIVSGKNEGEGLLTMNGAVALAQKSATAVSSPFTPSLIADPVWPNPLLYGGKDGNNTFLGNGGRAPLEVSTLLQFSACRMTPSRFATDTPVSWLSDSLAVSGGLNASSVFDRLRSLDYDLGASFAIGTSAECPTTPHRKTRGPNRSPLLNLDSSLLSTTMPSVGGHKTASHELQTAPLNPDNSAGVVTPVVETHSTYLSKCLDVRRDTAEMNEEVREFLRGKADSGSGPTQLGSATAAAVLSISGPLEFETLSTIVEVDSSQGSDRVLPTDLMYENTCLTTTAAYECETERADDTTFSEAIEGDIPQPQLVAKADGDGELLSSQNETTV